MILNHQLERYSKNINQPDIICDVSKIIAALIVNKVYDNYNKVSYLQKNKKCHKLEITFQKKVNFSQ